MRLTLAVAVAGALVAGGFFAGQSRATRDVSPSLQAQAKQLDELRGAVEELGRSLSLLAMLRPTSGAEPAACPEAPPAPAAAPPPDVSPAPATSRASPDEEASMGKAEGMFADASSRGRWTAEDEAALRQIRSETPGADWQPFMQKLAAALNAGRLRPAVAEASDPL